MNGGSAASAAQPLQCVDDETDDTGGVADGSVADDRVEMLEQAPLGLARHIRPQNGFDYGLEVDFYADVLRVAVAELVIPT